MVILPTAAKSETCRDAENFLAFAPSRRKFHQKLHSKECFIWRGWISRSVPAVGKGTWDGFENYRYPWCASHMIPRFCRRYWIPHEQGCVTAISVSCFKALQKSGEESLFLHLDKPSTNRSSASLPSYKTLPTPKVYRSELPCKTCRIPSTDSLFFLQSP